MFLTQKRGFFWFIHKSTPTITAVKNIYKCLLLKQFCGQLLQKKKNMAQISTLLTGAGVQTNITGQAQCEGFLVIGDVDTTNPLQGIIVEIDGVTFINIQAAALIAAFAKWGTKFVNTIVGLVFPLATGRVNGRTNIRLTNSGATTPAIFNFSDAPNGVPIMATTVSINALSYQDFQNFSALMIQTPANVNNIEITFSNGHKDTLTIAEVDALLALKIATEGDGRLGGVSVIDNSDQTIRNVRINATTAVNVLMVKLPDNAFALLNR